MSERMVSPGNSDEDRDEYSLRPKRLREFIGQPKIKETLSIFPAGRPGAWGVARPRPAPRPARIGQDQPLAHHRQRDGGAAARHVRPRHRAPRRSGRHPDQPRDRQCPVRRRDPPPVPACRGDSVLGDGGLPGRYRDRQGPSARTIKLDVNPFTLVGATTRAGLLTSPLRDRFGIQSNFEFYTPADLVEIITRSAAILSVDTDLGGAQELARRSRGTPRIANRLLKRVRDFAQVRADGHISQEVASAALAMLEVDARGLDETDRRLLRILIEKFGGGPVGVETLAAALSEERDTIEDVYEPYLMQQGFLMRTPVAVSPPASPTSISASSRPVPRRIRARCSSRSAVALP